MRLILALGLCVVATASSAASRAPPLRDPVLLNIGFVCKWQESCVKRQQRAMGKALGYVRSEKPAAWKVQLCNRQARRAHRRVDWIGFNNCIRNRKLTRRAR